MEKLTMPRKEIEKQLSKMKNYDEIRKSIHWEEWINTVFSWGMLGFDNIDVYDLIRGKSCELIRLQAASLKELKQQVMKRIDPACIGIVMGTQISEYDLDLTHKMMEILAVHVNVDSNLLMQALRGSKEDVMLMLVVQPIYSLDL